MLQALVRMGNFSLQRNMLQKEILIFFYFPNSKLCGLVNILLKKNGHDSKFHDYFATLIK